MNSANDIFIHTRALYICQCMSIYIKECSSKGYSSLRSVMSFFALVSIRWYGVFSLYELCISEAIRTEKLNVKQAEKPNCPSLYHGSQHQNMSRIYGAYGVFRLAYFRVLYQTRAVDTCLLLVSCTKIGTYSGMFNLSSTQMFDFSVSVL